VGDDVTFLPSGRRTKVRSVEKWREPDLSSARAGECVGLTFADEVFVERGEVLARSDEPPVVCDELQASVFWLSNRPFERGKTYRLKLATAEVEATCVDIEERLDSSTLEVTERHAATLETTEAGSVVFALKRPLAADPYLENARLGRFVLEDGLFIGGGGILRALRTAEGRGAAQVIDLDHRLTSEPDGNLVDLTRVHGGLEFVVTPHFLDLLARGERILFRLRGIPQLEPVGLLAYEQHLSFTFRRERDHVSVLLWRDKELAPTRGSHDYGI
jgi:bifunctional enzyme CysN/CysC/sulfate adenylyltransferase subunit 1